MMDLLSFDKILVPQNEIQLWYAAFDANAAKIDKYKNLLSQKEVLKASKFKFQIDKNRFIISRAILKCLLGGYLKIGPNEIILQTGEYGKPDFANKENLKFNISHSGNLLVLGFIKDIEIGVDVEKVKDDFDVMNIAQKFFSKREIKTLYALPEDEKQKAFYRCWTRKESFIKAKGSGLSFPLDSFTVSLDTDQDAKLLETSWDRSEQIRWNMFSFLPAEGYIGAVSIPLKAASIRYRNWDALPDSAIG